MSPGMMTPTPAATPSANLGAQAHAAGQVKQALTMLEKALPALGIESPLHKAVIAAITGLAKHLPAAGTSGGGLQDSMLRDLALQKQQQAPLAAAMLQRGAAPGGAPPTGSPPPGGMPASPGA